MIKGLLQINLDPPHISFDSHDGHYCGKSCTSEDIKALLIDLHAIMPSQNWPLDELTMRVHGQFASNTLQRFGPVKLSAVESRFGLKDQFLHLEAG